MENKFELAVLTYSKGWYHSSSSYVEEHNDLENLRVIVSCYTGIQQHLITDKNVLYMLFNMSLPYWKEISDYSVYQYIQDIIDLWNEYKHSEHCSVEDFNLELETIKTILQMLKITLIKLPIDIDPKLVDCFIDTYKHCRCGKCRASRNYVSTRI